MKNDYDYQLPWRPNYELRAITGWVFGASLTYVAGRWSGLPMQPFRMLIVVCGFMVLWRLPGALNVWYRKHRLARFKFEYLDAEQLARMVRKHPNRIWFGWGFDWGQRHAQLAYEILKRDVSDLVPTDHARMGSTGVHGLELREQDTGTVFRPLLRCPLEEPPG